MSYLLCGIFLAEAVCWFYGFGDRCVEDLLMEKKNQKKKENIYVENKNFNKTRRVKLCPSFKVLDETISDSRKSSRLKRCWG